MTHQIIDPPSPFAARSEWQDFRDEMIAAGSVTPQVQAMISLADAMLAAWEKGGAAAAAAVYREPEWRAE